MQGLGLQAEGRARAKGRVAPPGQAEGLQGQVSGTRWEEWERRGRPLGRPEGFGFYSDQDGSWDIRHRRDLGGGWGLSLPGEEPRRSHCRVQGNDGDGPGQRRGVGTWGRMTVCTAGTKRLGQKKKKSARGFLFCFVSFFSLQDKCVPEPEDALYTHWSGVVTAHQSQTWGGSCDWLSPS